MANFHIDFKKNIAKIFLHKITEAIDTSVFLSGSMDYKLGRGRLRGGLGLGLEKDGTPKISLMAGYIFSLIRT